MSGQLGMCISFFIQIVLRSFLPLFHPLSPNLPLPDTIISYHIMRLFLEGPLTVFLCEKHITVFLLLNVTEPTFALCSILISDSYFAMCCKEMPLATHSCNGRQQHVWGGMSIKISAIRPLFRYSWGLSLHRLQDEQDLITPVELFRCVSILGKHKVLFHHCGIQFKKHTYCTLLIPSQHLVGHGIFIYTFM